VYRLVQEALTNVLRHGTEPRAEVAVRYGHDEVEVSVANPGVFAEDGVRGLGLSGMERRVTSLGGRFAAGAEPTGFRVWAAIPVAAAS
jgi:signal transduction histidine kinase